MLTMRKEETEMRCEMGACAERADYVVGYEGAPEYLSLHLCAGCLREIELLARAARREAGKP